MKPRGKKELACSAPRAPLRISYFSFSPVLLEIDLIYEEEIFCKVIFNLIDALCFPRGAYTNIKLHIILFDSLEFK